MLFVWKSNNSKVINKTFSFLVKMVMQHIHCVRIFDVTKIIHFCRCQTQGHECHLWHKWVLQYFGWVIHPEVTCNSYWEFVPKQVFAVFRWFWDWNKTRRKKSNSEYLDLIFKREKALLYRRLEVEKYADSNLTRVVRWSIDHPVMFVEIWRRRRISLLMASFPFSPS